MPLDALVKQHAAMSVKAKAARSLSLMNGLSVAAELAAEQLTFNEMVIQELKALGSLAHPGRREQDKDPEA